MLQYVDWTLKRDAVGFQTTPLRGFESNPSLDERVDFGVSVKRTPD